LVGWNFPKIFCPIKSSFDIPQQKTKQKTRG